MFTAEEAQPMQRGKLKPAIYTLWRHALEFSRSCRRDDGATFNAANEALLNIQKSSSQ